MKVHIHSGSYEQSSVAKMSGSWVTGQSSTLALRSLVLQHPTVSFPWEVDEIDNYLLLFNKLLLHLSGSPESACPEAGYEKEGHTCKSLF